MKLGLIAGLGDIPRLIAEDFKARNEAIFVIGIQGIEPSWIKDFPHKVCGIAETGKMLKALHEADCDVVSLIGNVARPDFRKLKPDLKAIKLLPKVITAASKGDDALLRSLVAIFEDEGFRVAGADELLSSLRVTPGIIAGKRPRADTLADIHHAFVIAGEMGRLDIGQGAIVADGLVLAVEAQEGTDEMLRRVEKLPENIRGTEDQRRGVLVKRPKPIQERRVDLPTIGPATLRLASAAGLSAIAVVDGGALIVGRDEIKSLAEALDMSVVCLTQEGRLE